MKPKITDEEKKEILKTIIEKLKYCNYLLDEAYKCHLIASGKGAANDKVDNT